MADLNTSRFDHSTSDAYDRFMGRYSRELAVRMCDQAGLGAPMATLDVGCGTGALTAEMIRRLGADAVSACDPSPTFVEGVTNRYPGVTIKPGAAESLPFEDDAFNLASAQLVLHFVADPLKSVEEMKRVTKPGGYVSASVWDMTGGMGLFRAFGQAGSVVVPGERSFHPAKFGKPGEIVELFEQAGLDSVREDLLTVDVGYEHYDDLWSSLLEAAGPTLAFISQLSPDQRLQMREVLFDCIGQPNGPFTITASAWSAIGTKPNAA